jgi:hypothetical protein
MPRNRGGRVVRALPGANEGRRWAHEPEFGAHFKEALA